MVAVHFFEMHKGWFASEMNSSYSLVDRTKPKRNANIELLRCILMFLIVFHHASFWGCWKGDCSQHLLIFLGTLAVMWHVDAFVAISGWFGVRFTWRKFFALWSQVAFYSILSILCVWHSGGQLNLKALSVNGGWFASAYFLLMLISPVLNAGVEGLVAKGKEAVISSWKILAIGIVLSSCPIFLITGVGCGASEAISVSLLVFVYASSRLARLTEARVKWKMIFLLMFSYLLLVGVGYMSIVYIFGSEQAFRWCIPRMVAYNLPWVWVLGISVVVFFCAKCACFWLCGKGGVFVCAEHVCRISLAPYDIIRAIAFCCPRALASKEDQYSADCNCFSEFGVLFCRLYID